jgi:hypothetical protein
VPAVFLILVGERERGLGDLRPAGGELGDCCLGEPDDHPAFAGGRVGRIEPEPPDPGGLAALHRGRQAVARSALPGVDRAFGGTGRLQRVRGVVPAHDADDDCHDRFLSLLSTIFELELD